MNHTDIFCTDARTDSPMRLSFPSCEELGIPMHNEDLDNVLFPVRIPRGFSFQLQPPKNPSKADPFSPFSMIPLPSPFIVDSSVEPTFIRKRNERERERVRCVNDGYSRLKEHIPIDNKDKRVSKVEILRSTISYIKHLQTLLEEDDDKQNDVNVDDAVTETEKIEPNVITNVDVFSDEEDDDKSTDASMDSEPPRKRSRR